MLASRLRADGTRRHRRGSKAMLRADGLGSLDVLEGGMQIVNGLVNVAQELVNRMSDRCLRGNVRAL